MAQVNDDPRDNLDVNCLNVATSHSYSSMISIGSVHSKIFFISFIFRGNIGRKTFASCIAGQDFKMMAIDFLGEQRILHPQNHIY